MFRGCDKQKKHNKYAVHCNWKPFAGLTCAAPPVANLLSVAITYATNNLGFHIYLLIWLSDIYFKDNILSHCCVQCSSNYLWNNFVNGWHHKMHWVLKFCNYTASVDVWLNAWYSFLYRTLLSDQLQILNILWNLQRALNKWFILLTWKPLRTKHSSWHFCKAQWISHYPSLEQTLRHTSMLCFVPSALVRLTHWSEEPVPGVQFLFESFIQRVNVCMHVCHSMFEMGNVSIRLCHCLGKVLYLLFIIMCECVD